ncbi:MAG: hypothetical protein OHK0052_20380 [Anaerolineales bacterium]
MSTYLWVNNLRVHALVRNPGSQPAVVLLHGLASNCRIWQRVIKFLPEDWAVYAPDLRGHGLTDSPESAYTFDEITQDLAALLNLWNVRAPLLVGHSWGAAVAVAFAARFAAGPLAPAALTLVDGGVTRLRDLPNASWESVSQRLAPPPLTGVPVEDFLQRIRQNSLWQPQDEDEQILLANFEVDSEERIRPRLARTHHMQILRALWDFDTFAQLARVRCPVLGLMAHPGEPRDTREREFLALKETGCQWVQQHLRGAQIHWFQQSIHDLPLQHPQAVAMAMVNFWEKSKGVV